MPWPLNEHPDSIVTIFTSFIPGFRLVDGGDLQDMAHLLFSARDDMTGGIGQSDAVPIETFISQITTGSTVVLPPAVPGRYVRVLNDTANVLNVYAALFNPITGMGDTVAPTTSSAQTTFAQQAVGISAEYICFAPGMWKQATGGSGPGPTGGIPEAPINGVTYGRLDGAWVPVLGLSGGTMTGPLILEPTGPGGPVNQYQAVSYNDVNEMLGDLSIDEGTY